MGAFTGTSPVDDAWVNFCMHLEGTWISQASPRVFGIADWVQSAISQAAVSGPGRSLRSIERRLKRSTGQSKRTLEFYAAMEELHKTAHTNSEESLADLAYAAGYADQSHMGRALRRATGFTPARLNEALKSEEPFWCYRLLGERF